MQLTTYLRALRKSWWIILLLLVLGALGGVLRTVQATPVYATTTTFYVSTPGNANSQSQFADQQFAEARANSYVEVLTSDRLARLVIDDTGLNLSPRDLAGRISAAVQLNTITVSATVQDTSKSRALRIARSVSREFPELVDTLDNRGQTPKSVVIDVLSGPDNPGQISPRGSLNVALGLGAGLVLGLIIAALRELLDTNIRTVAAAEEIVGKPPLGTIPFDSGTAVSPLIIGDQASTSRAEAMRQIRTSLQFVDVDSPPRVIVVTSATAVEGKSTTATNLALAFAETESSVVLVEADLRRPRVTDYTGIERTVGLSNVLAGQVELDDVLQPFGDTLQVLPSGPTPPNAAAMVGSARMAALVEELRTRFDVVVIDTPPLLPVTDAALLATVSDGVVIVLRHGRVSRVQLTTTCRSLEAVSAPVLGFVLNMIPKRQAREYGGHYDGYYTEADGRPDKKSDAESAPVEDEPEDEVDAVVEDEPEDEAEVEDEPEDEPEVEAEVEDEPEAVVEDEPGAVVEDEPGAVVEDEPEAESEAVVEDEPEVEAEVEAEVEDEPEAVVEDEPEAESEAVVEDEPEVESEAVVEAEPEAVVEDEPSDPAPEVEPAAVEEPAKPSGKGSGKAAGKAKQTDGDAPRYSTPPPGARAGARRRGNNRASGRSKSAGRRG